MSEAERKAKAKAHAKEVRDLANRLRLSNPEKYGQHGARPQHGSKYYGPQLHYVKDGLSRAMKDAREQLRKK